MVETEFRWSQIQYVPAALASPVFRNRKEWRRYQVMLKRLSAEIDKSILAAIYGDRYDCNRQPTSYPPNRAPGPTAMDIANGAFC